MNIKHLIIGVALCITNSVAQASVISITEVDMPGGVPALQAERATWASGLGTLMTEGFEGSFAVSNSIDFGSFIVSLTGSSMSQYTGANALTRTEGNQSLGFSGSGVLTFTFFDNVSAFAMDWSSLESSNSTLDYLDSEGNSLANIFPSTNSVTAGFFGISDVNLSSLSFTVNSVETLEFDFIQIETDEAIGVPAPTGLTFIGMGIMLLAVRKMRA